MKAFAPLPIGSDHSLPAPSQAALFLDLDGTLLDIAPAPDQVTVPPNLLSNLLAVRRLVGSALAVVSGRPIAQLDALLPGVPYAVAGEHGGAIRYAPGQAPVRPALPTAPAHWRAEAERLAASMPGVMVEEKHHGFVLHYRAAPAAGTPLRLALEALLASSADHFALLPALMAWEVRPIGADKGTAVESLMRSPPFASRTPIFIGDDITDEDGMRASVARGGLGLRVDEAFGSPQAVRDWLAEIAREV
jgi:trehalose 6-phosphate phosphatase